MKKWRERRIHFYIGFIVVWGILNIIAVFQRSDLMQFLSLLFSIGLVTLSFILLRIQRPNR
jgi:hypothetical protein